MKKSQPKLGIKSTFNLDDGTLLAEAIVAEDGRWIRLDPSFYYQIQDLGPKSSARLAKWLAKQSEFISKHEKKYGPNKYE